MRIVVRGIPAPQGSKRHMGGGRMVEVSRAVNPWREAVRAETQRAMNGRPPLEGAVQVDASFYLPRPKSHYRTGRNAHLVKDRAPRRPCTPPDLDKLARAVLDGLTEGGAWLGDGQVALLVTSKDYVHTGHPAGCEINVYSMEAS